MKGKVYMKILRINDGKAEYTTDGKNYKVITDIGKDDIFSILDTIMSGEGEIDCEEENIYNDAEKIMYSSLKRKFESFIKESEKIQEELNSTFEPFINEYKL